MRRGSADTDFMPGTSPINPVSPVFEVVVTLLGILLLILVRSTFEMMKKRHLDPLKKIIEGGDKELDVRQLILANSETTLIAAKNSAAAVQGVVQVRDELQFARAEVRTEIGAVKSQVTILENKVDTNHAQLSARLDEHGRQINQLQNADKGHTDQIARIETTIGKRGLDQVLHDAAMAGQQLRKERK